MRGFSHIILYPLSLLLLLIGSACASSRYTSATNAKFYEEYSKKLGVEFKGNENKAIIKESAQWLGVKYKYGGVNKRGVDCSAFIGHVYKEAVGITLPRTSSVIAKSLNTVSKKNLQCGDIIFFTNKEKRVSHVGMYLADDKFIHASSSRGVVVDRLSTPYWTRYYAGSGRVKDLNETKKPRMQKSAEEKKVEEKPKLTTPKEEPVNKPATPAPTKKEEKTKKKSDDLNTKVVNDEIIIVFDENF
ncbi:MAG: C40 family peptidase [Prevotellaceae bacterium]|jgi:lipoprotein Spr|nr:C40 family peptidase [Prevotellaceae bacterium]